MLMSSYRIRTSNNSAFKTDVQYSYRYEYPVQVLYSYCSDVRHSTRTRNGVRDDSVGWYGIVSGRRGGMTINGTVATYGIRYVRLSPNEDHINHS